MGETIVAGAQQPLAVELGLLGDGRSVDAEPAVDKSSDQSPEPGRGAKLAGQLVTFGLRRLVGAFDLASEVGDQVGPDLLVPFFCLGVETDHEALFPRTIATSSGGTETLTTRHYGSWSNAQTLLFITLDCIRIAIQYRDA